MKISRRKPAHYATATTLHNSEPRELSALWNKLFKEMDKVRSRLKFDRRKHRRMMRRLERSAKTGAQVIWKPSSYIQS
jgi:hypothetical protein